MYKKLNQLKNSLQNSENKKVEQEYYQELEKVSGELLFEHLVALYNSLCKNT
jgi:hypothetical protein